MEGTFGGNGYVYGIDYGDGFMGVYYLQTHKVVCIKYVQHFACRLYLNKMVKNVPTKKGKKKGTDERNLVKC